MTDTEKLWGRTLDSLNIPWTRTIYGLGLFGTVVPCSFRLDSDETYVWIERASTARSLSVANWDSQPVALLLGDANGKIRWVTHPDLPHGGEAYLTGCDDCFGFAFSVEPSGPCKVCGSSETRDASLAELLENQRLLEQMDPQGENGGTSTGTSFNPNGASGRWERLRADLAKPQRSHAWTSLAALEDLLRRYPNFRAVGDLLLREFHLSRSRKDRAIRLPRILLVGSPSCGKSSFADELAQLLVDEDRTHLDFSHQIPYFTLVGSDSGFREAKEGRVLRALLGSSGAGPVHNPMLILDEVDKIVEHHQFDPLPALLSLLDEREAKSFTDEFLAAPTDASGILVIAIANDSSRIPAPLKSRFVEFQVPDYTEDELIDTVVPSVYRSWLTGFFEGTFPEELSRETRAHIAHRAQGIPRQLSQTIADLAATGYRELFARPTFESLGRRPAR